MIAGTPKTDVTIRIGRSIIQIQCEEAIIRCIIPIPATEEAVTKFSVLPATSKYMLFYSGIFIQLVSIRPISFIFSLA